MEIAFLKPKLMLGQVLVRQMRAHGLRCRDLARKTGIPVSTIYQWTYGASPKDLGAVALVAKALGLTLDGLLFDGCASATYEAQHTQITPLSGLYRIVIESVREKE